MSEAPILVALSGGVDSSVSAYLLREEGYPVETAYIRTWQNEEELGDCPAAEDIEDARAAAAHLGLPFRIVNLVEEYHRAVVTYLVEGYRRGITPNPDIFCNREIKFGTFLAHARAEGFGGIATGHYCRGGWEADGRYHLRAGVDPEKDQSYFLALTRREDLEWARFPVGHLRKPEVRALARRIGLPNAAKRDSQGICFLGKVKIDEFLAHYLPDRPGPIVDTDRRVLGEHRGLHTFTLGQRRGIGIPSNTDHRAYVVVAKDLDRNELVVGFDQPETPGLFQTGARVARANWIGDPPPHKGETLLARVRYRDPPTEVVVEGIGEEGLEVSFAEPQRALARGQILALYRGDELLGGAVYEELHSEIPLPA